MNIWQQEVEQEIQQAIRAYRTRRRTPRHLRVILGSGNRKIGLGTHATYRPVGTTCPPCPLEKYCYAKRGYVVFTQARAEGADDSPDMLPGRGYVRHLVSGDWLTTDSLGRSRLDVALLREVIAHHANNPALHGWSYTHDPDSLDDAGLGPDSWPDNFKILASTESAESAERLQDRGWNTARVSAMGIERDNETYCPYDAAKDEGHTADTNPVTCTDCGLCLPGANVNVCFSLQRGGKR